MLWGVVPKRSRRFVARYSSILLDTPLSFSRPIGLLWIRYFNISWARYCGWANNPICSTCKPLQINYQHYLNKKTLSHTSTHHKHSMITYTCLRLLQENIWRWTNLTSLVYGETFILWYHLWFLFLFKRTDTTAWSPCALLLDHTRTLLALFSSLIRLCGSLVAVAWAVLFPNTMAKLSCVVLLALCAVALAYPQFPTQVC